MIPIAKSPKPHEDQNPIIIKDVNPMILTITEPTLGSLGNVISSQDKIPI
jgi:hypothetical protein